MRKAILLNRKRTRFTTIKEEESCTLLNSQPHSFLTLQCCNGSHCLLPLTTHSLLYFSHSWLYTSSLCSPNNASIYRQKWWDKSHKTWHQLCHKISFHYVDRVFATKWQFPNRNFADEGIFWLFTDDGVG